MNFFNLNSNRFNMKEFFLFLKIREQLVSDINLSVLIYFYISIYEDLIDF